MQSGYTRPTHTHTQLFLVARSTSWTGGNYVAKREHTEGCDLTKGYVTLQAINGKITKFGMNILLQM